MATEQRRQVMRALGLRLLGIVLFIIIIWVLPTPNIKMVADADSIAAYPPPTDTPGPGPGPSPIQTRSIFGYVFVDVDGDGDRDSGERDGIRVDVELWKDGRRVARKTASSPTYWYSFEGLDSDKYLVKCPVPSPYVATSPTEVEVDLRIEPQVRVDFGVMRATPTPTVTQTPTPTATPQINLYLPLILKAYLFEAAPVGPREGLWAGSSNGVSVSFRIEGQQVENLEMTVPFGSEGTCTYTARIAIPISGNVFELSAPTLYLLGVLETTTSARGTYIARQCEAETGEYAGTWEAAWVSSGTSLSRDAPALDRAGLVRSEWSETKR